MSRAPILALDGWRGVSILMVLASHAAPRLGVPGGLGVTIFFFISGLLITGQLLDERAATGAVDLRRFYRRRALRLLPPFVVFVALGGLAFTAGGGTIRPLAWPAALFYGANYAELATRLFDTDVAGLPHPFVILWSLAVEEHFYAVWPLALIVLARLGGRPALFVGIAVALAACLAWRAHLAPICATGACGPHGDDWIGKSTDTRADSLAFGALAALLGRAGDGGRRFVSLCRAPATTAASLALLLGSVAVRDPYFRDTARYTLQGVALLFLVPASLDAGHLLTPVLTRPLLVAVGRLSYGLYLFHWLALIVVSRLAGPQDARAALFLTLTAALAVASWYTIERPLIARRRRAGSQAAPDLLPPRADALAGRAALAG